MRIALGLEYDGRGFCGWQSQPGGCGVQDHVQAAVTAIAGEPVGVTAAGRTDTGVHAAVQVAHFDTSAARPLTAWVRGVNSALPSGVAVRWAVPVDASFHARFSARARRYRYVLHNHPVRPALLAGKVGWFHAPLDASAMAQAARLLCGSHDFSSFRSSECQARTPVKTVTDIDVVRHGEYLLFDIRADGFLHHMVRNIVGALVFVGKGARPPEWMGELLQARSRGAAPPMFMADGLYLTGIEYGSEWPLPDGGRIIAYPPLAAAV